MKKSVLLISLLFLAGCAKESISSEITEGNDINIELLFEKDGCKMYRFRDGGRYIYWSNCEGKTQYSYSTSTNAGKNITTHHVEEITNTK